MNATANVAMFIIIMCAAFFARVRPVTRKAKPTCMNSTRKPHTSIHVKLIDTPRCPVWFARVLIPTCDIGTSGFALLKLPSPLNDGPVGSAGGGDPTSRR